MALTNKEKQKIIDEENFRNELRNKNRNKNRENTPIDDYAEGAGYALLVGLIIFIGFILYHIFR